MTKTITFHIGKEDKNKIVSLAKKEGLSLSSWCRFKLLKIARNEEVSLEDE